MATAELAVALPALLLVFGLLAPVLTAGIDRVRCLDAAGSAARLAARGDSSVHVRAQAVAKAPAGASAVVLGGPQVVTVTVSCPVPRPLRPLIGAAAQPVSASARVESALGEAQ